MNVFIIACIAAVIIAAIGGLVLNSVQKPVDKVFATSALRLGT